MDSGSLKNVASLLHFTTYMLRNTMQCATYNVVNEHYYIITCQTTRCLKNEPHLASCSFIKHGLILIIWTLSEIIYKFNFIRLLTFTYFICV